MMRERWSGVAWAIVAVSALGVRADTGVTAAELRAGGLIASMDRSGGLTLSAGEVVLLRGDCSQVRRDWSSPELLPLIAGQARVTLQRGGTGQCLTWEVRRQGVGSLSRRVELLADEAWVLWDLRLDGASDQAIGQIGALIPRETAFGRPFRLVDESLRTMTGRLGVVAPNRPVYNAVRWGQTFIAEASDALNGQLPPGFLVRSLRQLTLGLEAHRACYDLVYDHTGGDDWEASEFQDVGDQRPDYPARVAFVVKSRHCRIRVALRVRMQPAAADQATWEDPVVGDDVLDLVDDPFVLTLARDRKWTYSGEPLRVRATALGQADAARPVAARYRLLDYSDRVVERGVFRLDETDAHSPCHILRFAPRHTGMYRLLVEYDAGTATRQRQAIFGVFPRPAHTGSDTVFAAHVPLTSEYTALAEAAGVSWVRLWHTESFTTWGAVEPQEGRLVFVDGPVALARQHHLRLLGMLEGVPGWIPAEQQRAWTSEQYLDRWLRYVRQVVAHYRGAIDHWEVLNEPGFFPPFRDRPDLYVRLLQATYVVVKSANPQAVVIGCNGPAGWGMDWWDKVFKLGALNCLDAVSVHYASEGCRVPEWDKDAADWDDRAIQSLDQIRGMMRDHGVVKPIWNTEDMVWLDGVFYGRTYGPSDRDTGRHDVSQIPKPVYREHCSRLVRLYLAHMARGARLFYFHWWGSGWWRLTEADHTPTPPIIAQAVMASLLDGTAYREHIIRGQLQAHVLARAAGGSIAVVYGYRLPSGGAAPTEPGPWELRMPVASGGLKALDIMGNDSAIVRGGQEAVLPVGGEPVYLVSDSLSAAALAVAIRASTFAPRGDARH